MTDFQEGISRLETARSRLLAERRGRERRLLSPEALLGVTLRPGDRVHDKITGEEGDVISVSIRTIQDPAAPRP